MCDLQGPICQMPEGGSSPPTGFQKIGKLLILYFLVKILSGCLPTGLLAQIGHRWFRKRMLKKRNFFNYRVDKTWNVFKNNRIYNATKKQQVTFLLSQSTMESDVDVHAQVQTNDSIYAVCTVQNSTINSESFQSQQVRTQKQFESILTRKLTNPTDKLQASQFKSPVLSKF
jgi:hypothetical protein